MPLEVYLSQADRILTLEDPTALDALFLKRVFRTVKHDATFMSENRLCEVPDRYAGQKVEIPYDEEQLHTGDLSKGSFMKLTIIRGVRSHHRLAQEEVFGPILSVITFETVEEAIQLMNGTEFILRDR